MPFAPIYVKVFHVSVKKAIWDQERLDFYLQMIKIRNEAKSLKNSKSNL